MRRGVFGERSEGRFSHKYGLIKGVAGWSQLPDYLQGPNEGFFHEFGLAQLRGLRRWGLHLPASSWGVGQSWCYVWIPLWIPFVLLAVPTALLWWRDRKPPSGHCKRCGYDLTGNLSGVCPECGQSTHS